MNATHGEFVYFANLGIVVKYENVLLSYEL